MHLYNSLTGKKDPFHPIHGSNVSLYTCGPTVYDYPHIGNLRTYIFEDILKRTLKYNGYTVDHVMNITDVGHLTDDADSGEDKMEKGSRREGKTTWELAEFYTLVFKKNLSDLNILEPKIWCKATDHIAEQIAMVEQLREKGFTYETLDGIYFDTTKVEDYGKLVNLKKQDLKAGVRVEMADKKNLHDFALWKFTPEGEKRQMEWEFGMKEGKPRMGFPGWHIECSAMAMKYLGDHMDIHCGGIDHKPLHHTNEIAQSEASTGKKPWVNVWMHGEFLTVDEGRMGKSQGNFITLETVKEKGFEPLEYRYFLLLAHYRRQLSFSWEALEAAAQGLKNLRSYVSEIPEHHPSDPVHEKAFLEAINDDLNTPTALAELWTAVKEKTIDLDTVIRFDKVLGLNLHVPKKAEDPLPESIQELIQERADARESKNFSLSDQLRQAILNKGYSVEDTKDGQVVKKM